MKIIKKPEGVLSWSTDMHTSGASVALVPTMGCLHAGHLSLIDIAKKTADKVIVSIFINPIQFGPNEDLEAYPRQFEQDCSLAKEHGAHAIFAPVDTDMYDSSFQTSISVNKLSSGLCGADRPGHFDGVATVVTKLFNIVRPDTAVFGEKDFQQLCIIKQLVADLNIPVKIVSGPIVREADGLAMSSRNKYLQGKDRQAALSLSSAIIRVKQLVETGKGLISTDPILQEVKAIILKAGAELEYAEIVHKKTLCPQPQVNKDSVIMLAAKIGGRVRLIDNSFLQ